MTRHSQYILDFLNTLAELDSAIDDTIDLRLPLLEDIAEADAPLTQLPAHKEAL